MMSATLNYAPVRYIICLLLGKWGMMQKNCLFSHDQVSRKKLAERYRSYHRLYCHYTDDLCYYFKTDNRNKTHSQTITDCVNRELKHWSADSAQHNQRLTAVQDFIIESGYPVTMVDQPSFRSMITTLDSKFKMPGIQKLPLLTNFVFMIRDHWPFHKVLN